MNKNSNADFLTAAGKRLEYAWVNRKPAPGETVLIFLHEGLGCIALWRDFPQKLSEACGLPGLVYSRAGYGGSEGIDLPRPITYQEDEARDALTDVLDTLGIEKAILIGHSDGGTIALIHAGLDERGRVLGAATMAAHVFNEEICIEGIREARKVWDSTDLRDKLQRYHGDNVDTAFYGWNDTWQREDYWHWNVEIYLPRITCPLLVMQGKDDHYGSQAQVDAIVQGAGGAAEKLMIDDCGHNPHFDQPEKTIAAISRFVEVFHDRAADGR